MNSSVSDSVTKMHTFQKHQQKRGQDMHELNQQLAVYNDSMLPTPAQHNSTPQLLMLYPNRVQNAQQIRALQVINKSPMGTQYAANPAVLSTAGQNHNVTLNLKQVIPPTSQASEEISFMPQQRQQAINRPQVHHSFPPPIVAMPIFAAPVVFPSGTWIQLLPNDCQKNEMQKSEASQLCQKQQLDNFVKMQQHQAEMLQIIYQQQQVQKHQQIQAQTIYQSVQKQQHQAQMQQGVPKQQCQAQMLQEHMKLEMTQGIEQTRSMIKMPESGQHQHRMREKLLEKSPVEHAIKSDCPIFPPHMDEPGTSLGPRKVGQVSYASVVRMKCNRPLNPPGTRTSDPSGGKADCSSVNLCKLKEPASKEYSMTPPAPGVGNKKLIVGRGRPVNVCKLKGSASTEYSMTPPAPGVANKNLIVGRGRPVNVCKLQEPASTEYSMTPPAPGVANKNLIVGRGRPVNVRKLQEPASTEYSMPPPAPGIANKNLIVGRGRPVNVCKLQEPASTEYSMPPPAPGVANKNPIVGRQPSVSAAQGTILGTGPAGSGPFMRKSVDVSRLAMFPPLNHGVCHVPSSTTFCAPIDQLQSPAVTPPPALEESPVTPMEQVAKPVCVADLLMMQINTPKAHICRQALPGMNPNSRNFIPGSTQHDIQEHCF